MAADLHIHALTRSVTEADLAAFFSNSIGSKWFNPTPTSDRRSDEVYDLVAHTPSVWIGEVSWLKAALFEDSTTFIPDPVGRIAELIGEDLPVLDEELAGKIREALGATNDTSYEVASPRDADLEVFLTENLGRQLFTVSW